MGYQVKKTVVVVDFPEESPFHGAEIRMALSIRNALDLSKLIGEGGNVDMENMDTVIGLLMELIVSWNLEMEDGTPIPVTREAFNEHIDIPLMAAMFIGFARGVGQATAVDLPLPQASNAGAI